jgi:acetate kinase
MHLLALNSGSSSLKFGLYRAARTGIARVYAGEIENIGEAASALHVQDAAGQTVCCEHVLIADPRAAMARISNWLAASDAPAPQAIGHRIVHGGPSLLKHCLLDAAVLAQLEAATAFAPVHMPAALSMIRDAARHFPGLAQVACLDTCFHAAMPAVASTLPLPHELRALGLRRYGFHGLSCESIVRQLGSALPARLLIAHLGSGASITAVHHGVSIDTSMGLTPSGGLLMGTRSGDLDPGVLIHLMRALKLDAAAMEAVVDQRSGMLAVSGSSGDLRTLHQAATTQAEAGLAIEMFCCGAAKTLGALGTVLNGADLIVFTGGIGEHDAAARADICARLAILRVELDAARNRAGLGLISHDSSGCRVLVLPSQEEEQIAHHTWALCRDAGSAPG